MSETTRARGKRQKGAGPGHGGPANGPGWGGPAKGAGVKITAATQPTPEAKVAGKVEARSAAEASRQHAAKMVRVWLAIAEDPNAPPMARIVAGEKIVERAEGRPKQTQQFVGDPDNPLVTEIVYRWEGPDPKNA